MSIDELIQIAHRRVTKGGRIWYEDENGNVVPMYLVTRLNY